MAKTEVPEVDIRTGASIEVERIRYSDDRALFHSLTQIGVIDAAGNQVIIAEPADVPYLIQALQFALKVWEL